MKKIFAILLTVCTIALSAFSVAADATEVTTVGYSADRIIKVNLDDVYNIKYCEELLTHYPEYKITDVEGLKLLSTLVNSGDAFSGVTIYLANDIDMTGVSDFLPIGKGNFAFQGTFDGQGHAINNLKISLGNDYYYEDGSTKRACIGLFGFIYGNGTVKNLIMGEGCEFKCVGSGVIWETYVGSIAGLLKTGATIDNCYNMATVSSGKITGGIAGYCLNGDHVIKNCTNVGRLDYQEGNNWVKESNGQCTVGGILGSHQMGTTLVKNCRNAGTINGFGYSVGFGGAGGIVGRCAAANLTIEGCINNGAVNGGGSLSTAHSIAGGILGYGQFETTIKNCINYGKLTAEVGGTGIVGMRFVNSSTQALPTIHEENNVDKSLADPAETDATLAAALLGELNYNYVANEGNELVPPELEWNNNGTDSSDTTREPETANKPQLPTTPTTEAPGTDTAEAPSTTEAPAEEKKGCGSTVGGFAVILLTAGAAVVGLKKKED